MLSDAVCENIDTTGREFVCSKCRTQWHLLTRDSVLEEWRHVREPAYCPNCQRIVNHRSKEGGAE